MRKIRDSVSAMGGTLLFALVGTGVPLALSGCDIRQAETNGSAEDTATAQTADASDVETGRMNEPTAGSVNLNASAERLQSLTGNPVAATPATPESEGRAAATPAPTDVHKGEHAAEAKAQ